MREATLADLSLVASWIERDSGACNEAAIHGFLHDPMNVCLIEGEGGALFVWRGPGIFELHLMLEQRGAQAKAVLNFMLDRMRGEHGARTFWAAVPWDTTKQSRKVRLFARLMGWESRGRANLATGLTELFISE